MSCNAPSLKDLNSRIEKSKEEIDAAEILLQENKNINKNTLTEEKRKEIQDELTYFRNYKDALEKEKAKCDTQNKTGGRRKTRKNKKSKRKTKSRR